MSQDWSDEELLVAVRAYKEMASLAETGQPYSNIYYQDLITRFNRTETSVESCLQKISAVLCEGSQSRIDELKFGCVDENFKARILAVRHDEDHHLGFSKCKTKIGQQSEDESILVRKNKEYFSSVGIDYAIFEPTITGLKKSILDATFAVRTLFDLEGFHSFSTQGQGEVHKKIKSAFFVENYILHKASVSLYRPNTKSGDPRMWFRGLRDFAKPEDQIAIVVFDDALYLFNFSENDFSYVASEFKEFRRISLLPPVETGDFSKTINNQSLISKQKEQSCQNNNVIEFWSSYFFSKNGLADELLKKLRIIAKKPIVATTVGDTAIGMAVEAALGISANSSKKPDYQGKIEIKSGRGAKNRSTLFAQVPDWLHPEGRYRSSADILNSFGYKRLDDFKLYCTVSTQKPNSQGLFFVYDESTDLLIEKHNDLGNVVVWTGEILRNRLLEKHAETFWINARSTFIDDVEHFELISVTHTKRPLSNQLLPLIKAGIVTMDHLIKRKGGGKPSVSEKGPLFKIKKEDLALLFPAPQTYLLR